MAQASILMSPNACSNRFSPPSARASGSASFSRARSSSATVAPSASRRWRMNTAPSSPSPSRSARDHWEPYRDNSAMSRSSVLVVEDNDLERQITADTLREEGFNVEEAATGKRALECLGLGEFDVVLTDLMMPGMTGDEL